MNKQTIAQNLQTIAEVLNTVLCPVSESAKISRIGQAIQAISQEINSTNGQVAPVVKEEPAPKDKPKVEAKAA